MPIWLYHSFPDLSMTIALLIALAGSLAAMAVIVRRLDQR